MDSRFEFVKVLGQGGQGRVTLVRDHRRQGRLVALKRLGADEQRRAELAREFDRLARLRHPNLAAAFDFGEDDEGPYFTSEYVDGEPIPVFARKAPEKDLIWSMGSLLRALALLHDRDLVHGDVTAENVLVARAAAREDSGHRPRVKLLDLGGATRPGQPGTCSTAGFVAPEGLTGRGLLPASDLYSFGVVLSLVLFNRHPFAGVDASDTVSRQLRGEPSLPDAALSPMAALCLDLLALDPAARPRSAQEALRRLAEASETDLGLDLRAIGPEDLPAPKMVGRLTELAALLRLMDRLEDAGAQRVAAIDGPLGSGRSSLLAEVRREAQIAGLEVIGHVGGPPCADDILVGLAAAAGQEGLSPAARRALAPWLGGGEKTEAGAPSASAVGFAAVEALHLGAAKRPLVLVADDFDAAGELVREVLFTLARALAPERADRPRAVLMTAGAGPAAGPARLGISLRPLDGRAVGRLVASMLPAVDAPEGFADAVFVASGGWPGHAEQLVRQAVGPAGGDLAERVKRVAQEIGSAAKDLLFALRFVERPIPREAAFALGVGEDELERLAGLGLLAATSARDGLEIAATGAAREAAEELVDAARAKSAATRLGAELLRRDRKGGAARLFAAAGDGQRAAEIYAALAREHAERGDLNGAGQWYGEALGLFPEDGAASATAAEAVAVWRSLGEYEKALTALPRAGWNERVRLETAAELTLEQGRHAEALALVEPALAADRSDARLCGVAAAAMLQLGRHEQALGEAREAMAQATEAVSRSDRARLRQIGGLACVYLGRTDEAAELLNEAARGFEQGNDVLGLLKVSSNLGMLQRERGDFAGARAAYDRAVALARKIGDRPREGLNLMNRATVSHAACDFAAAHEDYLLALDIAALLGNAFREAQVEVNLADLLLDLGDEQGATRTAAQALERCRAMGQERLEVRALLTLGAAALRAGDPVRAERRLAEARRRFAAAGDEIGRTAAEIYLAELKLARGDLAGAAELARATADAASTKGRFRERARALIVLAEARIASGADLAEIPVVLDDAEHALKREPAPDFLWRINLHRSRVLELLGRRDEAGRALAAARSGLTGVLGRVPPRFKESFRDAARAPELVARAAADTEPGTADRRVRDLELLMEVNWELTRERDPKRLLALIMEHAVELTGAERGMVVMPRGDALEPVTSHQLSSETDLSFSRSVADKVFAEGRAVLAVDALDDDRFRAFVSVNAMKLRSILAVPLQIKRRVVGVIYLDSRLRSGIFGEADRRLLEAFGVQAAIALETARLVAENAKRLDDLKAANEEIQSLSRQLEEKLERNEAKLKRVGALLHRAQQDEAERLRSHGIVGRSPAMQRVLTMVERIALTDVPVYVFGASGTGKELVARAIHAASERREAPFVAVNCGALPAKLLASELFGHKKGSFTGAVSERAGLFRVADNGTLFLDEVTDMDPEMQAHLLRVLQDGTFRALGGNEEMSVDVRVISASNRDLVEEVKSGRFREDLFYRLNVVRIDVPSLGDRREDVPLLVDHLAARHAGKEGLRFSREAMDALVGADWPGNVRELENEVLRAMALATSGEPIGLEDLSPRLVPAAGRDAAPCSGTLKDRVAGFERSVIQRVLAECGNNATRTAKLLGVSRAGLYKKLGKRAFLR